MAPQVVIFCDLQKPIRVAAEVMGKSLDAVIDGKAVKIHMPEVTWETIFRTPELRPPTQFMVLPSYETTYQTGNRTVGQVYVVSRNISCQWTCNVRSTKNARSQQAV